MPAELLRTRLVLDECKEHLGDSGAEKTMIEVYLARGVVMTLCSEIEAAVTELVFKRVDSNSDAEIVAFSRSVARIVRNAKPGQIGDLLSRFGDGCKERY